MKCENIRRALPTHRQPRMRFGSLSLEALVNFMLANLISLSLRVHVPSFGLLRLLLRRADHRDHFH